MKNEVLPIVKRNALESRFASFQQSSYFVNRSFVEEMIKNGFRFNPQSHGHNNIVETIQCTWCGAICGPFHEPVNILAEHNLAHAQGHPKVSCPFLKL